MAMKAFDLVFTLLLALALVGIYAFVLLVDWLTRD
jgi:hypothetical protein